MDDLELSATLLAQGPRFQITDDFALTMEPVEGGLEDEYELGVEWSEDSSWEGLDLLSEEEFDAWLMALLRRLDYAIAEGVIFEFPPFLKSEERGQPEQLV
jgi:hypothetical protein